MTERISVAETAAYLADAERRFSDEERAKIVDLISADPEAGILLDGGIRKLRVRLKGRGKSGGARVIYYFGGRNIPVYLLAIFGKTEKANLSRGELNELVKLVKILKHSIRRN